MITLSYGETMPYIEDFKRDPFDFYIDSLKNVITNEGEVAYVLNEIICAYAKKKGRNYATLSSVIGIIECAKMELNRRIIAVYEDEKKIENGDVKGFS